MPYTQEGWPSPDHSEPPLLPLPPMLGSLRAMSPSAPERPATPAVAYHASPAHQAPLASPAQWPPRAGAATVAPWPSSPAPAEPGHGALVWDERAGWHYAAALAPRDPRRVIAMLWALVALLVAAGAAIPFVFGSTPARGAVDAALTSTLAQTTLQVSFDAALSRGATSVHLTGTSRIDASTRQVATTLALSGSGRTLALAVRATGSTVYLSAPGLLTLPAGKEWVSMPETGTVSSGSLGSISKLSDPSASLDLLKQAGASVQTLGPSSVDGVAVTGYRIVLTPATIANLLQQDGVAPSSDPNIATSGLGDVNLTVLVDSSGLIRSLSITSSGQLAGAPYSLTFSMQFSDFGQPVSVTVPPATQVTTASQAHSLLSGSSLIS